MGEAAKAFWYQEEELAELEMENDDELEDVSALSTGTSDHLWKFGSD